jgi:hypothetical protein
VTSLTFDRSCYSTADKLIGWVSQLLDGFPPSDVVSPTFPLKAFRDIAERVRQRRWTAYLIGGAIRDLVISRGTRTPRDLDVVVSDVGREELLNEFKDFPFVGLTRFGGLRIRYFGILLDIWPLGETYTSGGRHLDAIQDLTKCAFLDVEAIAMEIGPRKGRKRKVVESGFTSAVISRTLEINCESNPFPEVSVVKALRTALRLNLAIGPRLIEFVQRMHWKPRVLFEAQKSHFGEPMFSRDEMNWWLEAVCQWDARQGPLTLGTGLVPNRKWLVQLLGNYHKGNTNTHPQGRMNRRGKAPTKDPKRKIRNVAHA